MFVLSCSSHASVVKLNHLFMQGICQSLHQQPNETPFPLTSETGTQWVQEKYLQLYI